MKSGFFLEPSELLPLTSDILLSYSMGFFFFFLSLKINFTRGEKMKHFWLWEGGGGNKQIQ